MTISIASLHSTEFAVGQRYLSDTESELGLGVVIDVDDRCVHILFPQSEETRVYAKNSAPLSRVVFKVGDTIYDQDGKSYTVNAVDEVMGVLKYSVDEHEGGTASYAISIGRPSTQRVDGRACRYHRASALYRTRSR